MSPRATSNEEDTIMSPIATPALESDRSRSTPRATPPVSGAHFREKGAGPGVVLLHASASSSGQWRPLMDRLAGRFRTLAADLYGSGQSPAWPAERPMSLADEVALLAPVLAAAGPRFHLIGHSYGGAVALMTALANPGRVESLVLFEPVMFSVLTPENSPEALLEIATVRDDTVAAVQAGNPEASGARFVNYWMGGSAWAGMPEARREAIATQMPHVKDQWHALFMEPAPLAAFGALDVPVLYLIGTESPSSTLEVARLLVKTLPRVTVAEVEGAGHMAPLTHPERVNGLIEDFLRAR
jgi:pimeloyl-ACP methyl ester carboxylesterase